MQKGISREGRRKCQRNLRLKTRPFCTSSALVSAVVTLVKKISSTLQLRRWKSISGEGRRTWGTILQMADYIDTEDNACQHLGRTSVMTSVPQVPRDEAFRRNEETESCGRRTMLRPERKTVVWMKNLVGKFTKREILVTDF